jgi:hypothetical protein
MWLPEDSAMPQADQQPRLDPTPRHDELPEPEITLKPVAENDAEKTEDQ